ncbi:DUF169 domain-containing protein [Listeria sp. PSOL-1]|uniref:DUF169 domain-containing protein n=1 Tax=Listeria sp. PSOL-1 TaxID=1844999 RepID=UPI0013D2C82E|nr:DUF169 domain-containing protein [Listeria sp. PSOL-1]
MEWQNYSSLNKRINYLLALDREIVGIYFLHHKEDFERFDAPQPKKQATYCRFVQKATAGEPFKIDANNLACKAAAISLGLIDEMDKQTDIERYVHMDVYQNLAVSKQVLDEMVGCQKKNAGIGILPISYWKKDPNIVLVITNPHNAMRMVQGNVYHNGQLTNIKMAGMQGICQETTSFPYESGQMNISLMCSGTRHVARWKDTELSVGFPFSIFIQVVCGLEKTMNSMELIEKKRTIIERLEEGNDFDFYDVRKKENYFRGVYRKDV